MGADAYNWSEMLPTRLDQWLLPVGDTGSKNYPDRKLSPSEFGRRVLLDDR